MDLYGELPKLCRHLHLPLQAGSNEVLLRMKRDYSRETYLSRVELSEEKRCPDMVFSTDHHCRISGGDRSRLRADDGKSSAGGVLVGLFVQVFQDPTPFALKLEDDVRRNRNRTD